MNAPARDPLARARRKPTPGDWAEDDAMTLAEAVAVFWPDGPLTVASLRTEIAKGRLTRCRVAGKDFVTPAALRALFKAAECPAQPKAPASISGEAGSTTAPAGRSPTPTSSVTDRERSAQAAARVAYEKLKRPCPDTSPRNSRRRRPQPSAQVIQLRS